MSTGDFTNIVSLSVLRVQRVMWSSGIFRLVNLPLRSITLSPSIERFNETSSEPLSSTRVVWNVSECPWKSITDRQVCTAVNDNHGNRKTLYS